MSLQVPILPLVAGWTCAFIKAVFCRAIFISSLTIFFVQKWERGCNDFPETKLTDLTLRLVCNMYGTFLTRFMTYNLLTATGKSDAYVTFEFFYVNYGWTLVTRISGGLFSSCDVLQSRRYVILSCFTPKKDVLFSISNISPRQTLIPHLLLFPTFSSLLKFNAPSWNLWPNAIDKMLKSTY